MSTCNRAPSYTNILDLPQVLSMGPGDFFIIQQPEATGIIDYANVKFAIENMLFADTFNEHTVDISALSSSTTNLQTRVTSLERSLGQAISALSATNSNISIVQTTVNQTSGIGVDGTTMTFSSPQVLSVKSIGSGNINNNAITFDKLASSSTIDEARAVTTDHIRDKSITSVKIADFNVTTAKIADAAVGTAQLIDANITAAKLNGGQTGTAPIFGVRAWAKFEGAATNSACIINSSGNITSITRISNGLYEVVMTTAMPDANYCIQLTSKSAINRVDQAFTKTTTTFRVDFLNSSSQLVNPEEAHVIVLR